MRTIEGKGQRMEIHPDNRGYPPLYPTTNTSHVPSKF